MSSRTLSYRSPHIMEPSFALVKSTATLSLFPADLIFPPTRKSILFFLEKVTASSLLLSKSSHVFFDTTSNSFSRENSIIKSPVIAVSYTHLTLPTTHDV